MMAFFIGNEGSEILVKQFLKIILPKLTTLREEGVYTPMEQAVMT
jgi:hypothetical protein